LKAALASAGVQAEKAFADTASVALQLLSPLVSLKK
jgi:hypothetical protein